MALRSAAKSGTKPSLADAGSGFSVPTLEDLQKELQRVNYRKRYAETLRSTVNALIIVAAITILVSMVWIPVLKVYGSSMSPTLAEDSIVVANKTNRIGRGDLISFYYQNKILIKRVIGMPGDMVEIAGDGTVTVNGEVQTEDYVTEAAIGECDITFPYQVPEGRYFVLGDNRPVSLDSRTTAVGCVGDDQIVGKIAFCFWPLSDFGMPD